MYKIIIIPIFILLFCNNAFAHKEWVHQYILKEAYRFLELQLGKPIPPYWRQIMRYNNGTLYAKDIDRFRKRPVETSLAEKVKINY